MSKEELGYAQGQAGQQLYAAMVGAWRNWTQSPIAWATSEMPRLLHKPVDLTESYESYLLQEAAKSFIDGDN